MLINYFRSRKMIVSCCFVCLWGSFLLLLLLLFVVVVVVVVCLFLFSSSSFSSVFLFWCLFVRLLLFC